MKTIQNMMMMAAVLTCALIATASAAEYGQPVKEVEKEARSAVNGRCIAKPYSSNFSGSGYCSFADVPAGKILAVRHVSVVCAFRPGSNVTTTQFYVPQDSSLMHVLPLQGQGADWLGTTIRAGDGPAFLHVAGPNKLHFAFAHTAGPTPGTECHANFQGFLLDQQ